MTAEYDFPVDSSKASGRKSYCKACDGRPGRAYYDARKDELYAQREAVREAAWQAQLGALAEGHRENRGHEEAARGPVSSPEGVPALDRRTRSEPGGDHRESPPPDSA
jgi:hypothetical protein